MAGKKRILVAPLDWGLGHATRCIPIIRELIRRGEDVWIAAEGNSKLLLKKEFPGLTFLSLRGYPIRYSLFFPMALSMFFRVPGILWSILREHSELKKIIREHKIDAVISDNRYGLWNKKIPSVFITHQVMIKSPDPFKFLEPLFYRISKFFISKYNDCWIPDDERKFSGDLSHRYPLPANAQFIGILSRWNRTKENSVKKKYDVIGMVSGPEPHRTSLEKLLIKQFSNTTLDALIVLGKPGEQIDEQLQPHLRLTAHLESEQLSEAIAASELVICRAGYSSVMDLIAVGKDAVLIPTRGQTEQVYLAKYLKERKLFFSTEEKYFHLKTAMSETKKYSAAFFPGQTDRLSKIISAWLTKISAS